MSDPVLDLVVRIRTRMRATFTPDMAGVDWRDDAAIQRFVYDLHAILLHAERERR